MDQKTIVKKLYGGLPCATATGPQIIGTINGNWKSTDGKYFKARGFPLLEVSFHQPNPNAFAQVARELKNEYPVINGALGHATVMTAMTYDVNQLPRQIVVRDPWPGLLNDKRVLTPKQFYNTFFVAAVRVQPA